MGLGTTVALKTGGDVWHIAKVDGQSITLVSADDRKATVTAGELVDLYKVVKKQHDIVVRSTDFLKIEAHPSSVKSSIGYHARQLLFHAFRLHQPNACVDMKLIKGGLRKGISSQQLDTPPAA